MTTANVRKPLGGPDSITDDRVLTNAATRSVGDPSHRAAAAVESVPPGPRLVTTDVLVVDDDPVQRLHLSTMLERLGHGTTLAADGYEALDILERFRPEIILIDWRMPGIDGRETVRRIRRRERTSGDAPVRIIGMTGAALLTERRRCLEAGMDDYLVKPFGIGTLTDALERCSAAREAAATDDTGGGWGSIDHTLDALTLSLGDSGFVVAIAQRFLDDLPERLDAIVGGIDADVRAGAARQLARSSRSVGAHQLAALSAEIESSDHSVEALRRIDAVAATSARLIRTWMIGPVDQLMVDDASA